MGIWRVPGSRVCAHKTCPKRLLTSTAAPHALARRNRQCTLLSASGSACPGTRPMQQQLTAQGLIAMQIPAASKLWILCTLLAASAACETAPTRPFADGAACTYQGDCRNACIDGKCSPKRKEGEPCTRPGFELHDCETGLKCETATSTCVPLGASASSGSSPCKPACGAAEMCVGLGGDPTCVPYCTANSQCADNCCTSTKAGKHVCVPKSYCPSPAGGGTGGTSGGSSSCVDLRACLAVTATAGSSCAGGKLIKLTVSNGCSSAAEVQTCQAMPNGSCDCMAATVAAGGAYTFSSACSTGPYQIVGGTPNDPTCPHLSTCQ